MTVEANTILKERRNKFESSGISIKTQSIIGHHPIDKIIEFADNEKADLIIIGSTGLRGISKIKVLGSVSRGVSERATISCPVMLVH
jgi:nucleotide-binding universal stress UspA family protein